MVTQIRLSELRKLAADRPGMWQAFLGSGKISGVHLLITREDFDRLQSKWLAGLSLGTVIHKALAPLVKVVDQIAGTKLSNCGGCAEREMKLNAATQKLL